jgi:hypothetical protein
MDSKNLNKMQSNTCMFLHLALDKLI